MRLRAANDKVRFTVLLLALVVGRLRLRDSSAEIALSSRARSCLSSAIVPVRRVFIRNIDDRAIIILLLAFGGGGGYYGYQRWGTGGGVGIFGLVLIILVLFYVFGGMRMPH
jgi:hypothetical protein